MTNEKYITSETPEGKWDILCHAQTCGVQRIETLRSDGKWVPTYTKVIKGLVMTMREDNAVYRIPNPDYVERWPIGTVLEREIVKGVMRYTVVGHCGNGDIRMLGDDLDFYELKQEYFCGYKPTGEHIDLTPLLGETND